MAKLELTEKEITNVKSSLLKLSNDFIGVCRRCDIKVNDYFDKLINNDKIDIKQFFSTITEGINDLMNLIENGTNGILSHEYYYVHLSRFIEKLVALDNDIWELNLNDDSLSLKTEIKESIERFRNSIKNLKIAIVKSRFSWEFWLPLKIPLAWYGLYWSYRIWKWLNK